ncbi:hypothetical protein P389DRAFT_112527 [Cystobasidium minutum MCA 4210]|uniref:uncharacterized protein n=1 Tax=Cystobasidium minutum MCA 4210 TaxID=1397322 RepID=UPI0034CEA8B6|eukprot:jgi/Rhomi1/112527/CE112526_1304
MPAYDSVRQVDKVTIEVLVDNAIEWFHPWPQEFQPEMVGKLQKNPPPDPKTGVPFLDLEKSCCGAHGLSLLITTEIDEEKHTFIFDCGPESKSIDRNIKALQVDLTKVEAIALSHWHSDHSGGILQALKLITEAKSQSNDPIPTLVDLHPDRPEARAIWPPHLPAPLIRLPDDPTLEKITAAGGKVKKHNEAHTIAGNTAYISGQIKRQTSFETGLVGGSQWVDGEWKRGPGNPGWVVMDERYLMMDVKDKGLIVLSSCSHAGIVNVCKSAIEATGHTRPLLAVIGGYHLGGTGMVERIPDTVKYFAEELEPRATFLVPMHCTGFTAKVALGNALGSSVIPAGSGSRMTFDSKSTAVNMMPAN